MVIRQEERPSHTYIYAPMQPLSRETLLTFIASATSHEWTIWVGTGDGKVFGGGGDVIARPARKSRRRDHAREHHARPARSARRATATSWRPARRTRWKRTRARAWLLCDAKRGCSEICAGRRCKAAASLGSTSMELFSGHNCQSFLLFVRHSSSPPQSSPDRSLMRHRKA